MLCRMVQDGSRGGQCCVGMHVCMYVWGPMLCRMVADGNDVQDDSGDGVQNGCSVYIPRVVPALILLCGRILYSTDNIFVGATSRQTCTA